MTYSQPTTRKVNVTGRTGSGPGVPAIELPSVTPMSPNGKLIDERNPGLLYESKVKEGEALINFITTLVGDKDSGLLGMATQNLQAEAKSQAGAFIAEQGIDAVSDENQPRWRELNPRAQSYAQVQQAQYATSLAGQLYNAEVTANPILTQPSEGNPELQAQQAQVRAQALATAREKSGFSAVTPYLQMQNASALMQVTAAVDGQAYKARAVNADQQRQTEAVNEISSEIEGFEGTAGIFGSTNERVSGLRALLEKKAQELAQFYPTKTISQILSRAIAEQLPGIIQSKDEVNLTLADLKALATQEILVNGENIWDALGPKGKSLRLRLNEAVEEAGNQRDSRIVGLATQEAIRLIGANEGQAAIDVIVSSGLDVGPENVGLITSALNTISKPLTDAQNGAQMELRNRKISEKKTWQELWPEIIDGVRTEKYSARFGALIAEKIERGEDTSPDSKVEAEINATWNRLANSGELGLAESAVVQAAQRIGITDPVLIENLKLQLRGKTTTFQRERNAADDGYSITDGATQALEDARDFLVKGLSGGPTTEEAQAETGWLRAAGELQFFRTEAAKTNGKLTDSLFSPYIVEQAKLISGNDTPTLRDKTKALVGLLATAPMPDGKPLYDSREAAAREVQKALKDQAKPGSQFDPLGWLFSGGNIGYELDQITKDSAKKILNEAGVEPKEDGSNAEQVGTALTEASLRSLGGATDPQAKLLNPEGYQALHASMKGIPMPLGTLAPQLDPESEARIIPTFFGSQNDEMFVAIGIAEGTRTADGGYTRHWNGHKDPGDGHFNRGTVSGGRGNNLSAAQVDKQYRGILAQTAIATRPVLLSIGLRPGTVAYNNVMFSALDLKVQAPKALPGFLLNISISRDFTLEGIAKARADAFFDPATGRLDTTFPSYNILLRDQRSRAGALQFRRRI